ncbi:MAG: hypothetical protein IKX54_00035 [Lachnospiraceae bacterium]|nr:hypothetical protein [Lachnospiraceae bacterium]
MFGRKKQPKLRDVIREMSYDSGAELRTPEEIDREIAEEEAQAAEENRVVDPIEEGSDRALAELKEAEAVHVDLIVGCVCLSALLLIGMIWARPMLRYAAGVVAGGVAAVYLLVHMYRSIGWQLTMEPQRAERYARGRAALRYVIVLLVLVAVAMGLGKTACIGSMLAILMMKPAAYMQPLTAKIRRKLGFRR